MDDALPLSARAALEAMIGAEHVAVDRAERASVASGWYPVAAKQKQANDGVPPRLVRAVVSPGTVEEVAALVRWANETRTPLVPVGGASNTVGSAEPKSGGGVAVRLARLQNLDVDEYALLARAGAGWNLGALERALNERGYTLGHLPRSLDLATVGGSVATNAAGLLSGKYGRQADLTLGLEVVLPTGEIVRTSNVPGASVGPDLVRLFVGSEGTLGIVTNATLRIFPVPDVRAWAAFTFPDFVTGLDALRLVHRTAARPAVARLFDGDASADLLARHGLSPGTPLLILAFEGDELVQTGLYQMAHAVCQKVGGTAQPAEIGAAWFEDRLETSGMAPNARPGGLADTLDVAVVWSSARQVGDAVRTAILPLVTQLHVHAAHATPNGCALEFPFQAQAEPATPDAAIALHRRIVAAGLEASLDAGGSIAHHYGVGAARRDFLEREMGATGFALLRRIRHALDPNHIFHPGEPGTGD